MALLFEAGYYDIGIAGGVESMSSNSMDRWDGGINQEALQHPSAKGCYLNMGQVMRYPTWSVFSPWCSATEA